MPIDSQSRAELQEALVKYMTGEINTFAFDDRNSSISTADPSVRQISSALYGIHDDFVDHPISIPLAGWGALRRILAFLETDLEIAEDAEEASWPFRDEREWRQHEPSTEKWPLPDFDALIHNRPVNHWTRKISTSEGIAIIATLIALASLIAYATG
jgi:hypothetical protein